MRLLSILFLSLCMAASAAAQDPTAPRLKSATGKLTVLQWPLVEFNGKPLRSAPGARILTVNKLTVTPNMVPAGSKVRVDFNDDGQIRLIQILPN
jgi:hypothetical protein